MHGWNGQVSQFTPFAVYDVADGKLIATRAGSTALSWHPLKPIVALSSVVQDIEQLVLWDFVLDQVLFTVPQTFAELVINKSWSPDGSWLACACILSHDIDGQDDAYVQDFCAASGHRQLRSQATSTD